MKRIFNTILKVLLAVLAIGVTISVVIFVLFKTGILHGKEEQPGIFKHTTEDGKIWTENNWQWVPAKIDKTPTYDETLLGSEKGVFYLHLTNNDYYKVEVPLGYECYWDYGKCVYAKNGEFCIRLVNNLNQYNLATMAGITDAESISSNVITNKEEKRTFRVLASLVGDTGYGIICEIYSGDDVYTVLQDSLLKGLDNLVSVSNDSNYTLLDRLPVYDGEFTQRNITSDFSLKTAKYAFADGDLYLQSDVRPLNNIVNEYVTLLEIMSNNAEVVGYAGEGFYYFEAGDAYLGMYAYNFNTTEVMIGVGEETKCNILYILNNLN